MAGSWYLPRGRIGRQRWWLGYVVAFVLLVPNIGALVCRLHDRDHSGAWLLWLLVPVVGWFVLVVTVGFLRGSVGPNQYGRPPGTGVEGASWSS